MWWPRSGAGARYRARSQGPAPSSPSCTVGDNSTIRSPPIARYIGLLLIIGALLSASVLAQVPIAEEGRKTCLSGSARKAADAVLAALVAKDGEQLALFAHPQKGVRFSPSAFVNIDEDVVLSREQVKSLWTDPTTHVWGYAEGSGDPIEMTSAAYAERYVLDRGFSQPASVNVNDDQAAGTTSNNAGEIYPEATRVEYYVDPSIQDPQRTNEWAALRLVLENVQGCWLLIAIIHDAWSV